MVVHPVAAKPLVVSLEYRAPPECPDRGAFVREVLGRLSNVRIASDGESGRHFEIAVESTPEGNTARLEFFDEDSRRVEREINAPDCDEAVSSIALITALAIDPRLSITS